MEVVSASYTGPYHPMDKGLDSTHSRYGGDGNKRTPCPYRELNSGRQSITAHGPFVN
jgi:hypothetical protein